MSDNEPTENKTTAEPTTTTTEGGASEPSKVTPAAPAVDVDALVKQATAKLQEQTNKTVSDAVQAKMRSEFKRLAGEPEEKKANPLLNAMVSDPDNFFTVLSEGIQGEVEKKFKASEKQKTILTKVSAQYVRDYPELKNFEDIISSEFSKTNEETPLEERLGTSFKNAAKRLGLKPLSERNREEQQKYQGIPGVGGSASVADSVATLERSASDYINGRKAHNKKHRSRQVIQQASK